MYGSGQFPDTGRINTRSLDNVFMINCIDKIIKIFIKRFVDIPLSFGLEDIQPDSPNSAMITWNANQDVSVYLRINCISTEFTIRKRGGEKGIPFRIQIETYSASLCGGDPSKIEQPLHSASCKIKVFKVRPAIFSYF